MFTCWCLLLLTWVKRKHKNAQPFLPENLHPTDALHSWVHKQLSRNLDHAWPTWKKKTITQACDFSLIFISSIMHRIKVHSKTPNVVNVLWLDSDDVVTIVSSTRNLVEGYKTVYLCHLDSYTVTVCNRYLVSSHVVTVQLPTSCLVDRFLHRPHGSGYLITCPM